MEKIWKISLIVILIFLVPIIVSASIDKNFIKDDAKSLGTTTNYGKVELIDCGLWGYKCWLLGEGTREADLELKTNTDICAGSCEAIKEITLYKDTSLVDAVRFYKLDNGKETSSQIKSYQFYIQTGTDTEEVNDYKYTCIEGKTFINGTVEQICENKLIGSHIKETPIWESYTLGTIKSAGTYTIKLEGKKNSEWSVDWQVQSQGIWIDDWAVWHSGGLVSYWKLDDNGIDSVGTTTLNGSTNWTTGIINNGIGTNQSDYLSNLTINPFAVNQSMSVSLWVKFSQVSFDNELFSMSSGADTNFDLLIESKTIYWTVMSGVAINAVPFDEVTTDVWYHFVATYNGSELNIYKNGTLNATGLGTSSASAVTNTRIYLGFGTPTNWVNGTIDEVGLWNRSLSASEVSELYNSGAGLPYTLEEYICNYTYEGVNTALTCFSNNITIFSPMNETFGKIGNTVYLNYTDHPIGSSEVNYSESFVQNVSNNLTFYTNISTQVWNWRYDVLENNLSYNSSTYETARETFSINITANTSLTGTNLIYKGTSYAATQSGTIWSKTIDIPTVVGTNNFTWNFTYAGSSISSDINNQTVETTNLSICGGGGGSTVFLNFSFIDETAGTTMNASTDLADFDYWLGSGSVTKNYIFTNTTGNNDYNFCAIPNRTITTDLQFKYSNTGYPQRTFAYDDEALTNSITHKTLYLLPAADGIYSSIQVVTSVGSPISGVLIVLEREIGGVLTIIGQGTTGSDGVATFWVNPNYVHQITATKTGYTSVQVSITPSGSTYTITMSTGAGTGSYNSTIDGLSWIAHPGSGTLEPATNQRFNATVYSIVGLATIENCKLELLNASDISQVFSSSTSAATNATYCYISITYTTKVNQNIFGRLSVDTDRTDGYVILDSDWKWIIMDLNASSWRTVTSFFEELRDLSEFGEGNEAEFNRIVLFFLVMTILIGVFMFFSGIELDKPGANILIIYGIVIFASVGGFLTFDSGSDALSSIVEQFGFAIILTVLIIGFLLNLLRKSMD